MQIDQNLLYPMHYDRVISEIGPENMNKRHVLVLCLVSQGYCTTRQIMAATNAMECPPKAYQDILACLNVLNDNDFIHYNKNVLTPFYGKPHGVLSMKVKGYMYLSQLNESIIKAINKSYHPALIASTIRQVSQGVIPNAATAAAAKSKARNDRQVKWAKDKAFALAAKNKIKEEIKALSDRLAKKAKARAAKAKKAP